MAVGDGVVVVSVGASDEDLGLAVPVAAVGEIVDGVAVGMSVGMCDGATLGVVVGVVVGVGVGAWVGGASLATVCHVRAQSSQFSSMPKVVHALAHVPLHEGLSSAC